LRCTEHVADSNGNLSQASRSAPLDSLSEYF
jgi:hypothetical protein